MHLEAVFYYDSLLFIVLVQTANHCFESSLIHADQNDFALIVSLPVFGLIFQLHFEYSGHLKSW